MGEEEGNPPATEDEAMRNHLLSMLTDEEPSRRWKAAEGLARLGDPRALGPLVQLLEDGDWRVRRKAACACALWPSRGCRHDRWLVARLR